MYKYIWMLLLGLSYLHSVELPKLYISQFEPLYNAVEKFQSLASSGEMSTFVNRYVQESEEVRKAGITYELNHQPQERITYLHRLRTLQQHHDHLLALSKRNLLNAIEEDDHATFLNIVNSNIDFYTQPTLNEQILAYYESLNSPGSAPILDQLLRKNMTIERIYPGPVSTKRQQVTPKAALAAPAQKPVPTDKTIQTKKKKQMRVILVTRPNCPWCRKAKQLLNRERVRYTEYDLNSLNGRKLYQQYNATGVPLMIVGTQVLRGYNEQSILNAIK